MNWFLTLSLVFLITPLQAFADNLRLVKVAVASNFIAPMREICEAFELKYPYKVQLSTGSSGKFYALIKHGAPYDVLFSADQRIPKSLENEAVAVNGSRFTYALGSLALWSSKRGAITDPEKALKSGEFRKLALANPDLAPYGLAAVEVLKSLNLNNATRSKWVLGENISQTFQFSHSGNADLGFVAISQLIDRHGDGHSWTIPKKLYSPIKQDAVLLDKARDKLAAKLFLKFFSTDQVIAIIRKYGYQT